MFILEASQIRKFVNDRLLFRLDNLKIYQGERIGIVGRNGAGKTTLLKVLGGEVEPDEGIVRVLGSLQKISQFGVTDNLEAAPALAGKFRLMGLDPAVMSGGELTRLKIAACFSAQSHLILADEPTSNLDLEGVQLLEDYLKEYQGAVVLISHDRALMDALCQRILEVEAGKVREYPGNYSAYREQRDARLKRERFEYEQYLQEQKRLREAVLEKQQQARSVRKAPRRMGNSEARLHKGKAGEIKAKLDRASKAIETRLLKLEHKKPPGRLETVFFPFKGDATLSSKVAVSGENLCKSYGGRIILGNASFFVPRGTRTALVGANGSGKTTLLRMIAQREPGVCLAEGTRIGYFSQDLGWLNESGSVLDNVLQDSIYTPGEVRGLLARMLFKGEEINKPVRLLSGGERVKVALARLLARDVNLLLLDEPTNYLDIPSLEALEELLLRFPGTILLVAHDRVFLDRVTDQTLIISDGKLVRYLGNYTGYRQHLEYEQDGRDIRERVLQLELRLNLVLGKLCSPSGKDDLAALDGEYRSLSRELQALKGHLAR